MLCPCCSGLNYADCCQPFHVGKAAPTPLSLMRSRYTAYALKKADYIIDTTHPQNPSYDTNRGRWKKSILEFCNNTQFTHLEILETGADTVTFVASLQQNGKEFLLKEKSQFRKVDSKWLYLKALS